MDNVKILPSKCSQLDLKKTKKTGPREWDKSSVISFVGLVLELVENLLA
jgi:hypothetical protein